MLLDPSRFFEVEAQISMPGFTSYVGCWRWHEPFEALHPSSSLHRICLHLSGRSEDAAGRFSRNGYAGDFGEIGDLVFAPAGSEFHHHIDGKTQRVIYCEFDPNLFEPSRQISVESIGHVELNACLNLPLPRAKQRMMQIAEETSAPGYATEIMLESLTASTLVEVARFLQLRKQPDENIPGKLAPWHMRRIEGLLQNLSGRAPSVAEIASECGLSRSHLSRVFKNTTGRSIHTYVAELRMERAKTMIAETDLPLKVISYQVGFANQSAFSYAFSKATGLSPREFKQRFGRISHLH